MDEKYLAVHGVRVVAGEEADHRRDVFRLHRGAFRAHVDAGGSELFLDGVRDGRDHPGLRARHDAVGRHAVLAEIPGHDLGEAADSCLRGAIVGLACETDQARFRAEGDDAAALLLPEQNGCVLDQRERALEVDGDHVVPFFFGHVEDHPVSQDSGCGHDDVQAAKLVYGLLDQTLAGRHLRDRVSVGRGFAARGANRRRGLFGRTGRFAAAVDRAAHIVHDDFCAEFAKLESDGLAYPTSGAGNDRDAALEQISHFRSFHFGSL